MCKNLIKVKSKNPYNIKYSYIPCGKCEECRKAVKTQWTTRLKAEIEYYHTNLNFNVRIFNFNL